LHRGRRPYMALSVIRGADLTDFLYQRS
jgi:hypothetical protein